MIQRRKRRRVRLIATFTVVAILGVVGLLGAGFIGFVDKIPRTEETIGTRIQADAIVVLTGGGGRLELGLRLLSQGTAAQLFISGVDPGVDKVALLQSRQISGATLDCCITLGHNANDTFGNAIETRRWMESRGYKSLYIVTANYHMPRSLVEFRSVLPEWELTPLPVHPASVRLDDWWRWPGTIRLLASEYTKYLATLARTFLTA
ncbi:MAG: YdcF family protein [Alphaproteobacteria bacterium]|nr:YdcF family protein [Alphaproteobacteria bacterium]